MTTQSIPGSKGFMPEWVYLILTILLSPIWVPVVILILAYALILAVLQTHFDIFKVNDNEYIRLTRGH